MMVNTWEQGALLCGLRRICLGDGQYLGTGSSVVLPEEDLLG